MRRKSLFDGCSCWSTKFPARVGLRSVVPPVARKWRRAAYSVRSQLFDGPSRPAVQLNLPLPTIRADASAAYDDPTARKFEPPDHLADGSNEDES